MSFSERLKERRIAMDFTQAQLADKLGVTKSAICNYETGVSSPRIDILYKMFDVLDCDANMLFRDEIGEAENAERYAPPNVRELGMITKYRTLDAHGKRVVDLVLDEEAARVEADKAAKAATSKTAWRIEGTLREFPRFDPVNLWFDYPTHRTDTSGTLADLQPDSDAKTTGQRGAKKRWADGGKEKCTQKTAEKLANAFEATAADGESTIYEMAGYLDLKPETVRKKLKGSDAFWVEDEKVGRKKTE